LFRRAHRIATLAALVLFASAGGAPGQIPRLLALQGRLEDPPGVPWSGMATLTIRVFDASTGGSALATETEVVALGEDGLVQVTLGDSAPLAPEDFDQQLWAELEPAATGSPLAPRLPLRAAPYALRAAQAEALGARWLVVNHSGDPVESGARLEALVEPLVGTAAEPYVVFLEPGSYDLGSGTLDLPAWVSLHGSGRKTTTLGSDDPSILALVAMATGSELHDLTVAVSSTTDGATGVRVGQDALVRLEDVEVYVLSTAGSALGLLSTSTGSTAEVDLLGVHMEVTAVGANTARGVAMTEGRVLRARDCRIEASTGTDFALPLRVLDASAELVELHDTRLEATVGEGVALAARIDGAEEVRVAGCHLQASSSINLSASTALQVEAVDEFTLDGSRLLAESGNIADALVLEDLLGPAWVRDSHLEASGTSSNGSAAQDNVAEVHGSVLDGGNPVSASPGGAARVSSSRLRGGSVSGSVTCAFVTDASGPGFASTCP